MATQVEVVSPEGRSVVLKEGSLGISAVFFCIATAAAPMTALLFNVPVIVSGAGWAGPAAFIVALVMLLVFTVGYVEMTKRVTSAGGFYSFVSHGFGQTLGLGTATAVTFSYTILTASIVGIFAYFCKTTISAWTGVNIPLIVLLLAPVAVCLLFAYFDIKITARVLGVFFVAEVTAALVFSIAVLVQGGANGLTAAPFNPLKLFHNHGAIAVFGAAAPGVALFGAFWSWVGFEMAPNYGEESRQPRKIFAVATFGSLIALGVVYVLGSYAFTIGWGTNHTAQAVKAQFAGQTISAFYPLTTHYVGASLTDAFRLLIMTSSFACTLAFFNTSSRYVFALGRERILPSEARDVDADRRRVRAAAGDGADLVRDHPLLPRVCPRGGSLVEDAGGTAGGRRADAVLGLVAVSQSGGAVGRRGSDVHPLRVLADSDRLRARPRSGAVVSGAGLGALRGGRTLRPRGGLSDGLGAHPADSGQLSAWPARELVGFPWGRT